MQMKQKMSCDNGENGLFPVNFGVEVFLLSPL